MGDDEAMEKGGTKGVLTKAPKGFLRCPYFDGSYSFAVEGLSKTIWVIGTLARRQ